MRVLFITQYDERGASSRCRVYQYLPRLAARGIEGEVVTRFPPLARLWQQAGEVDAVFVQKRVPSLSRLLLLRRRTPCLLFDFDDAIWLRGAGSGQLRPAPLRKRLRLASTLRLADRVIAGNRYLADYARRWSSCVSILPTPVDVGRYARDERKGMRDEEEALSSLTPHPSSLSPGLTLGWVGHPSTLRYLRRLEPALAALGNRYPWLGLRVVCSEPYESAALPVENISWSLEKEVDNLSGFDIGLMPLEDDAWSRGKCAYKALQYMAMGVPVVCSPVGMNGEVIQDGANGLLAGDLDAWEQQLARLIESPELRQRLGAAGQHTVECDYSLVTVEERLAKLLTG